MRGRVAAPLTAEEEGMSQYVAQIYEEIMSIRGRVGLQLAKLYRNKVKHFDREPPTALDRRIYCGAIVALYQHLNHEPQTNHKPLKRKEL
jgi:hypothetical protein